MSQRRTNQRKWGPGVLVTAAFIGPGTVVVASKAGATNGFGLLWVIVFSVAAAIVFQEMAARLGIVTGDDLSVSLKNVSQTMWIKWLIIGLVLSAVLIGNSAYQTGNIAGAAVGLTTMTGWPDYFWATFISAVAAALLLSGSLELLQKVLMVMVGFMGILFVASAALARPDLGQMTQGLLVPRFDSESLLTVIALLGTTVAPYNLFLHSRTSIEVWHQKGATEEQLRQSIRQSRFDVSISIALGGLITMAILVTASSAFFQTGASFKQVADIATQLKPVLGPTSEVVFCLGLTAAGLTSAITAPMAAGFVAAGCFGWPDGLRDRRTRLVILIVIGCGLAAICLNGSSPAEVIFFAQVANGLILPFVAVFLLWIVNQQKKLGSFRNRIVGNLLAAVVLLVVAMLAVGNFVTIKATVMSWF